MIPETPDLELDRLAPQAGPGLRILPVVHARVEMAAVARLALERIDPGGVAVELPTPLADAALAAVRRLPRVSVVISEEPGEEALVWIVAPGDPFVEAMRWALERGRSVFCIDPDIRYRSRRRDPTPDPYAVWSLGPEAYLELVGPPEEEPEEADALREAGMAFHLSRAARAVGDAGVLALVGAAHAERLAARLQQPTAQPFARVRRSSVEVRHLDPESLTGLLADPPLAHAVWERVRAGDPPSQASLDAALSRRVSLVKFGLRLIHGQGDEPERERRLRLVDYASVRGTRALCGVPAPDRRALGGVVWRVGSGSYREQTDSEVATWQRRLFFGFARRFARLQGSLAAGLYEWVVAARGVADDNLAWEVFDAARCYPWQEASAEIASVRLDGSELDLGTRRVRFRRRFMRIKSRPVPIRARPTSGDPEEWLRGFDSAGICSYPPEDVIVEDYGRFLQQRAISVLAAETERSEPFTSSLLDGIDLKETLRNPQDDRIYVREQGRAPGDAGSVVVIFDADAENERYPYCMTWLGEHDQESDMAFYSTPPTDQIVGPGIMRATYGGFMLTMPRGRLYDVWHDRDYRFARTKPEVLILAAIDYSVEKVVVHVADKRPHERLKRYAAAQGKRLAHLPLGSLSPVTLKKIRVLHLLAGRDKREVACDFIW